jgi:hypothetical protein
LGREATPDLLLPLKRRRFGRPSPQRRVAAPFRQWLIGLAYRPSDGVGHHRSWHGTIVSRRQRVAPAWSASGIPQHRGWGERFGLSSALHPRAVTGAPSRPKTPSPEVTLPGPYVTPPPPEPPVATRWLLSSPEIGEFEQGVLHGCGPAQVGFGDRLSSFHRLTVSSRGKLSPEPLRLTRPFRAFGMSGSRFPGRCPGLSCRCPVRGVDAKRNFKTRQRGDRRRLSPRLRVGLVLARFRPSCMQRVSKPL